MSKPRVIVLSVVQQGLSVSEAAARFGVSRRWVHVLLARYRDSGLDAVEPRSHRPHSNPRQTPTELAERMVALRRELTGQGLDAGPVTLAARLRGEGWPVPSTSTIRRILHAAGLVSPQPGNSYPASRPPSPTSAGSPISPTGPWPTAATSRS
jgi:transposase